MQPHIHGNVAGFEHRPHLHGELHEAVPADLQPVANALFGVRFDALGVVYAPAVGAHRTFRPEPGFHVLIGGFFAVELRFGKLAGDVT